MVFWCCRPSGLRVLCLLLIERVCGCFRLYQERRSSLFDHPCKMSTKVKNFNGLFNCELCKVTCMSFATLQSHLRGAKHTKRERRLNLTVPTQKVIRSLKDYIDDPARNEPLIGLEYVVEYRELGKKHLTYFCKLCGVSNFLPCMIEHLTCLKHRKTYIIQKCHFVKLSPVENRAPVLRQKAQLIEEIQGVKMYTIVKDLSESLSPPEQPTKKESEELSPQKPNKCRWDTDDEDTENESTNIKHIGNPSVPAEKRPRKSLSPLADAAVGYARTSTRFMGSLMGKLAVKQIDDIICKPL